MKLDRRQSVDVFFNDGHGVRQRPISKIEKFTADNALTWIRGIHPIGPAEPHLIKNVAFAFTEDGTINRRVSPASEDRISHNRDCDGHRLLARGQALYRRDEQKDNRDKYWREQEKDARVLTCYNAGLPAEFVAVIASSPSFA